MAPAGLCSAPQMLCSESLSKSLASMALESTCRRRWNNEEKKTTEGAFDVKPSCFQKKTGELENMLLGPTVN